MKTKTIKEIKIWITLILGFTSAIDAFNSNNDIIKIGLISLAVLSLILKEVIEINFNIVAKGVETHGK